MPQNLLLPALVGVVAGLIVAFAVIAVNTHRQRSAADGILGAARGEAERLRTDAAREGEAAKQEVLVAAKMEALKQREDLDREVQRRREEWERLERRADERARSQERKVEELEARDRALAKRDEALTGREQALRAREGEADRLAQEQRVKLERIAGLSAEDARREILQRTEDESRAQAQALARDIKEQAKRGADREARRIISMAIQRLAAEHTAESTVAAVALPSEEMKGRIIGREGRNIRAFETATGVDVIIDDTPDTVSVSCFDPIRREVARRSLEALILDGRIHPGRIEEIVLKAQKELEGQLVELGEQAAYDTGIHGLHPEMIKLIGRMRYRTSYGQNIYDHSKEVAWLAGMMAAELHLDVMLAKRGGLLHDVGQGADPRERRHPRRAGRGGGAALRRDRAGHQLHPGPPRRRAARERRVGAGAGRRRDQRRPAWRPARGVRDVRQAAHTARGDRQRVPRGGEEQRHPGGARGARGGDAGADRRRGGGPALGDHRPQDRARASVPRPDQGRRHPGDQVRGLCTMSARILDGVPLANAIRGEVAEAVKRYAGSGKKPGLAVVIVGENPASQVYVKAKGKACEEAGMHSETVRLPEQATEAELLAVVERLNQDPEIHGFLVQLPLPKHINSERVLNAVNPAKDVDGFHPVNVGKLSIGDPTALKPATPFGVQQMLIRSGIETRGANAVIVGRSNIVGKPMASLLIQPGKGGDATVTICHSKSRDLPAVCRSADILVVAMGKPEFVTADMVRPGATVIDVGINRVDDSDATEGLPHRGRRGLCSGSGGRGRHHACAWWRGKDDDRDAAAEYIAGVSAGGGLN